MTRQSHIQILRIVVGCAALLVSGVRPIAADQIISYKVSFPAPEHHYAQVEVTFPDVKGTVEVRMSRSSPGRYALHEFAKNVFDVQSFNGDGKPIAIARPNPYQWNIDGHDGTARIVYKIYGDHVDGTYLAIDPTHAHMNMPATLMWARGLESRPVRVTFAPPANGAWVPATQLFPTEDPWTFTAPNLQYLMDSPTELSAQTIRSFTVRNPDGKTFTIRAAVHHDATDTEINEYVTGVDKIVKEHGAIFGEYPEFDTGSYTFLGDYVPWGGGDGMEHRNSTVVAAPVSLRTPGIVRDVLDTVSHEFFHAWNVERIRPKSLEPFSFEEANMSGELWLAEGFTQYYGNLVMVRSGLVPMPQGISGLVQPASSVITDPGRQFRSAVGMSQMAPFTDAARAVDSTNFANTFISYYTYGAAVALALDLSLRDRSNGALTLDDYMRAMWKVHGKPGGSQPGFVARPYTLQDARARLAEVSGDRAFADQFFDKYIEGREVVDYARLLQRAGFILRKARGGAWMGNVPVDQDGTITTLLDWGCPAFEAGLDQGDMILALDGKTLDSRTTVASVLKLHKPGDRLGVSFRRRDGTTGTATITLRENPEMEVVAVESNSGTLTADQKQFRSAWLGSRR